MLRLPAVSPVLAYPAIFACSRASWPSEPECFQLVCIVSFFKEESSWKLRVVHPVLSSNILTVFGPVASWIKIQSIYYLIFIVLGTEVKIVPWMAFQEGGTVQQKRQIINNESEVRKIYLWIGVVKKVQVTEIKTTTTKTTRWGELLHVESSGSLGCLGLILNALKAGLYTWTMSLASFLSEHHQWDPGPEVQVLCAFFVVVVEKT